MRIHSLRAMLALIAATYTIRASNLTKEAEETGEDIIPFGSF